MTNSAELAIAGMISVALRRKLNRVIDVEWMLHNEDYAREVLRIARTQNVAELSNYADRMEELIMSRGLSVKAPSVIQSSKKKSSIESNVEGDANIESQYIGALR